MKTGTPRLLIGLAIVAAAVAGAAAALYFKAGRPGAVAIPETALAALRATGYPDVNNVAQPWTQWDGKVIVLNFWATWCPPCREEMPMFSRMQRELGGRGVQFVGVGIDSPSAIKEFALRMPMSYPLLIGGSASLDLVRALGNANGALPYTIVFDRSGRPVMSRLGLIDETSLARVVLPLLDSPG
jgi:thiol-disulfide isomerase/thioredoxin